MEHTDISDNTGCNTANMASCAVLPSNDNRMLLDSLQIIDQQKGKLQ